MTRAYRACRLRESSEFLKKPKPIHCTNGSCGFSRSQATVWVPGQVVGLGARAYGTVCGIVANKVHFPRACQESRLGPLTMSLRIHLPCVQVRWVGMMSLPVLVCVCEASQARCQRRLWAPSPRADARPGRSHCFDQRARERTKQTGRVRIMRMQAIWAGL